MTTERKIITEKEIDSMWPQKIDTLPMPAEYKGRRKNWVAIGWVDEGEADGTEPLLISEE